MYKNSSVKCPHCSKLVVSSPTHRTNTFFLYGVAPLTVGTHLLGSGRVCPGSGAFAKSK